MKTYTAKRELAAADADEDWKIDQARQAAFREVNAAALDDRRGEPLPQDHAIDETVSPSEDFGVLIEVTLTVP